MTQRLPRGVRDLVAHSDRREAAGLPGSEVVREYHLDQQDRADRLAARDSILAPAGAPDEPVHYAPVSAAAVMRQPVARVRSEARPVQGGKVRWADRTSQRDALWDDLQHTQHGALVADAVLARWDDSDDTRELLARRDRDFDSLHYDRLLATHRHNRSCQVWVDGVPRCRIEVNAERIERREQRDADRAAGNAQRATAKKTARSERAAALEAKRAKDRERKARAKREREAREAAAADARAAAAARTSAYQEQAAANQAAGMNWEK